MAPLTLLGRGRIRARAPWALTAASLLAACTPIDSDLEELLVEYVAAQDAVHDQFGTYARTGDIVVRMEVPAGFRVRVLWQDSAWHGAIARSDAHPNRMCLVHGGAEAEWRGLGPSRVPVCDSPHRIDLMSLGQVPDELIVRDPFADLRRHNEALLGLLVAGVVLVLGLPRVGPWGHRVVFWTPAVLSIALLAVIGWWLTVGGSGVVNAGTELLPLLLAIPPLLLNLGLFAVPAAIVRAGAGTRIVALATTVVGTLVWGGVTLFMASPANDLPVLVLVAGGLFVVHVVGLARLILARDDDGRAADPSAG